MYKKIESELISILSDEYVEKIAHMPSRDIEKVMNLIFDIKFEDIERVYSEENDHYRKIIIIYKCDNKNDGCDCDYCMINGKMCHITFIPSYLLDKSENNVKQLIRFVCKYIAINTSLILRNRSLLPATDSTLDFIDTQSIPVLTCAIIRRFYSGASLSDCIYSVISEAIPLYKHIYSERGIDSLLDLFDDGLTVEELLDNSFICAIKPNDKKYPGIWDFGHSNKEEKKEEE